MARISDTRAEQVRGSTRPSGCRGCRGRARSGRSRAAPKYPTKTASVVASSPASSDGRRSGRRARDRRGRRSPTRISVDDAEDHEDRGTEHVDEQHVFDDAPPRRRAAPPRTRGGAWSRGATTRCPERPRSPRGTAGSRRAAPGSARNDVEAASRSSSPASSSTLPASTSTGTDSSTMRRRIGRWVRQPTTSTRRRSTSAQRTAITGVTPATPTR